MSPDPGWTTTATVSAHLLDVGLRLADAHGLDHHDVERRRQRLRRLARGRGEAAEARARRRRADQHAVVARVVLDPRAVAEQRAAGALRRRVHGEHRDAAAARRASRVTSADRSDDLPAPGRAR